MLILDALQKERTHGHLRTSDFGGHISLVRRSKTAIEEFVETLARIDLKAIDTLLDAPAVEAFAEFDWDPIDEIDEFTRNQ